MKTNWKHAAWKASVGPVVALSLTGACFFAPRTVETSATTSGNGAGGSGGGGGQGGDGEAPLVGLKWHPGVYVWTGITGCSVPEQVVDLGVLDGIVKGNSKITGIELRLDWTCLESAKGEYQPGFDYVDKYLSFAHDKGLKLMLVMNTYATGECVDGKPPTDTGAPEYFESDWVETCYGGRTWNIKFWKPEVGARLVALTRAYGAKYDPNRDFEMFSFATATDALVGDPDAGYVPGDANKQIHAFFDASRLVWKHTLLRNPINSLHSEAKLVEEIGDTSDPLAAYGGPNTFPDAGIEPVGNVVFRGETTIPNGTPPLRDHRGHAPWVAEIGHAELCDGKFCDGSRTLEDLASYARVTMQDSYVVWVVHNLDGDGGTDWPAENAFIAAGKSAPALTDCFGDLGGCAQP